MAFYNRVRLPLYLSQPQFPVDEEVYLKSNGRRRVLRSIVSKEYVAKTDWMPAEIHERLAIALRHDTVIIEGSKDIVGIRINGPYEIDWPEFLNHPIAPAKFKALEEAFVARNTRCGICETVIEAMTLRDDYFPTALDEGSETDINVKDNDDICCSDPVFSIHSINTTYVDTVTINPATGVATMTLKTPLPSTGEVEFFQYKVTCGDGSEETATVYGGIEGTLSEPCGMPENLLVLITDPFDGTGQATWTAPTPAPADGYSWYLMNMDTLTIVASGTTAGLLANLTGLLPATNYKFFVKSICGDDSESAYATEEFSTGPGDPPPLYYYDCEVYECSNCDEPLTTVVATSPDPALVFFKYYKMGSDPDKVLKVTGAAPGGIDPDTIIDGPWSTCLDACAG